MAAAANVILTPPPTPPRRERVLGMLSAVDAASARTPVAGSCSQAGPSAVLLGHVCHTAEPASVQPIAAPATEVNAATQPAAESLPASPARALPGTALPAPGQVLQAFENWRLDYHVGGPAAVHVSEFADLQQVAPSPDARREAYGRPVNKRDLGHRCYCCRRPFSTLGVAIVVELQGGPAQRFHADCWERRTGCEQPPIFGRQASLGPGCLGVEQLGADGDTDIVAAYVEEWRRASLDTGRPAVVRRLSRSSISRVSLLENVATIETEQGERRVVRGFTSREVEAAMSQWACSPVAGEECAICFDDPSQALRLPCSHAFCGGCVEPWLRRCALCPMCRTDLRPFLEALGLGVAAAQPVSPAAPPLRPVRSASRRGSPAPAAAPGGAPLLAGEWGFRVHKCGLPRPSP